jgi:hypothetical protein
MRSSFGAAFIAALFLFVASCASAPAPSSGNEIITPSGRMPHVPFDACIREWRALGRGSVMHEIVTVTEVQENSITGELRFFYFSKDAGQMVSADSANWRCRAIHGQHEAPAGGDPLFGGRGVSNGHA